MEACKPQARTCFPLMTVTRLPLGTSNTKLAVPTGPWTLSDVDLLGRKTFWTSAVRAEGGRIMSSSFSR